MEAALNPHLKGMRLGTIFRSVGLIDDEQEKQALAYSRTMGCPIGQACVRLGFVDEAEVLDALAAQMGVPAVSLSDIEVRRAVLALVPARVAEKARVIPLELLKPAKGGARWTLVVATARPLDLQVLDEVEFLTGHKVRPVLTTEAEIDAALARFYAVKLTAQDVANLEPTLPETTNPWKTPPGAKVVH